MSEREYMAILKKIIDSIFKNWDGSIAEFAKDSGLCVNTIYRYFSYSGKRPQFRTVLFMAKTAGINLYFDCSKKMKIRSVA